MKAYYCTCLLNSGSHKNSENYYSQMATICLGKSCPSTKMAGTKFPTPKNSTLICGFIIFQFSDLYRLIPTQQTISQVSEVLLHLFEKQLLSKTLNSANFFIDHLSANHLNNSKLVELFSNLAVRNDLEVGAVNRWIEMLPQVLLTGNGCAQHREVIKTLLKQRNTILLQALPQNFDYFQLVK